MSFKIVAGALLLCIPCIGLASSKERSGYNTGLRWPIIWLQKKTNRGDICSSIALQYFQHKLKDATFVMKYEPARQELLKLGLIDSLQNIPESYVRLYDQFGNDLISPRYRIR